MFHNLLVPVDLSDCSHHAVRLAVRLARQQRGRLTLLHAGPAPAVGADPELPLVRLYEQVAEATRQRVIAFATDSIPPDVAWSVEVREGAPADLILQLAGTGAYDAVVMGTHGREGLAHAILGSVTERVLRHATIPVVVTR